MLNRELSQIFYEISDFLEMEDSDFRPFAYRRAAAGLESMDRDVGEIYEKDGLRGLEKIPGIGKNIAVKIEEYIKTGKIGYYQKLKKKTPVEVNELTKIEGVGPKTVRVLFKNLGVRNLEDLERMAREHKIAPLFGFGKKTEENILEGIKFVKKTKGRFLLGEILPEAERILKELKGFPEVERADWAGSLRRMKETIGDVDFLAASDHPAGVMDRFVSLPGVVKVWGRGGTKASVRVKEGFNMDLRVVSLKSYGAALQHFTGSKEHNIALRKIAMEKGLKVNEYGVFRGKKMIAGRTEEEVYKKLGMLWIPPEIREDGGEIEAALENSLPDIIGYGDIKGDLHCHTDWSGGENTIEEMAGRAIEMGYQYIGISDHTKFLRIENGLDEKGLAKQGKAIKKANEKLKRKDFKILHGCEANIMPDGSIDIKDDALKELDFVIAGIHSNFKMTKNKMTERMIRAIRNPNVDIISHPAGRIIGRRGEYEIDFGRVLAAAKETGTFLEINSYPERLDLSDTNIRKAGDSGVKIVINTDAHRKNQMDFISFGVAQARRGWAKRKDIVNTLPLKRFIDELKQ